MKNTKVIIGALLIMFVMQSCRCWQQTYHIVGIEGLEMAHLSDVGTQFFDTKETYHVNSEISIDVRYDVDLIDSQNGSLDCDPEYTNEIVDFNISLSRDFQFDGGIIEAGSYLGDLDGVFESQKNLGPGKFLIFEEFFEKAIFDDAPYDLIIDVATDDDLEFKAELSLIFN